MIKQSPIVAPAKLSRIHKIVVFGKGGIGKSTIASNLAVAYARKGMRVLLVGCDPKHDTTLSLTRGIPARTAVDCPGFMDLKAKAHEFIVKGEFGIDCVESGGPEPGVGCAGRGISRTIEILDSCGLLRQDRYDVVLFDVLGDVVCGGFAAPLRMGFAQKVCVVVSEELMALYAANNISRAIRNYSANEIALCGLIANIKDAQAQPMSVERFAKSIGTRVLAFVPRDASVREAEYAGISALEHAPESEFSRVLCRLGQELLEIDASELRAPTPLSDVDFHRLSRTGFLGTVKKSEPSEAAPAPAAPIETPARNAPLRPRTEDHLSPVLETWAKVAEGGGSWIEGPHAQQWGDCAQWRNFFCDRESWRNADKAVSLDAPLLLITHEDMECHYATPSFDDGHGAYYNFPWIQREKPAVFSGSFETVEWTTDIKEADVIGGGSQKLAQALEQAMGKSSGKAAILVHSTCVPTVIGDDADDVINRFRKRSKTPIIYSNPASGQAVDLMEHLFAALKKTSSFRQTKAEPGLINLIGFPAGRARNELESLLNGSGIRVNSFLLPRFSMDDANRLLGASLNVFFPDPARKDLYDKLFADLEQRAITPTAPYGVENTRRWLMEVAKALGLESNAEAAWKMALPPSFDWEGIESRRLAFVADRTHVLRLTDPKALSGIPLVNMLKEMGFGLDYLLYRDGKGPMPRAKEGRHGFKCFSTQKELKKLLRTGGFDAVYSEYAFDRRLSRAGKSQFSLLDVEMGVSGALRTFRRLSNICRWSFYKRYAAVAPESP